MVSTFRKKPIENGEKHLHLQLAQNIMGLRSAEVRNDQRAQRLINGQSSPRFSRVLLGER
jgi:hypothetical protein